MSTQSSRTATTTGMFARGPRGFAGGMSPGLQPAEFDLPHPEIAPNVMLVVHQALTAAFQELRTQQGSLANDSEDAITIPLCKILENDIRHRKRLGRPGAVAGFDDTLVESIAHHTGTTNHDGTQLKKEPDLLLKLRPSDDARVLRTDYAIFVECKPVDRDHAVGRRYCDDGLNRFVEGEYAWAMKDGLMIGYTRHKRTIASHLQPALEAPLRRDALKLPRQGMALKGVPGAKATPQAERLHVSVHRRDFSWQWGKGLACPIRVYHSWHDCT